MIKQLTAEEIIQALDSADLFLRNRAKCTFARLNKYDKEVMLDIAHNCDSAVALIHRQKEEISVLKAQNGIYETCNSRKDERIRHLTEQIIKIEKEKEELQKFIERIG